MNDRGQIEAKSKKKKKKRENNIRILFFCLGVRNGVEIMFTEGYF